MRYETELKHGDFFYALSKKLLKIVKCQVDEIMVLENHWETIIQYKHYDSLDSDEPYKGTWYDQDEVFTSKEALLEHLNNSCDE